MMGVWGSAKKTELHNSAPSESGILFHWDRAIYLVVKSCPVPCATASQMVNHHTMVYVIELDKVLKRT